MQAKLFVPTILFVSFCFGVISYISYQHHTCFVTHTTQITRHIENNLKNHLLHAQKRNWNRINVLTNDWQFIDNVTLGNTRGLLDMIEPFQGHCGIMNIYNTTGKLLACMENPGSFNVRDNISLVFSEMPKKTDIFPVAVIYNKKIALISIKQIVGSYDPVGYLVVGKYLTRSTLSDLMLTGHKSGSVLRFFYKDKETLILGDKDITDIPEQKSTIITFSNRIDSSGTLSAHLIENISHAKNFFWNQQVVIIIIFSFVSLMVIIFSRKITLKIIKELELRVQERTHELQASENKFRSMMESMNDLVYICSEDYQVEYMNPAMIKRTGLDASGDFCHQAIHGLARPCPWCKDKYKSQEMYLESDVISPKDNRSYHVSHSPIVNDDDSISDMIVFRDTTDMKKLEAQLLQSQKMEAMGTLAGGIAHDFNNILTIILGYAKFAKENIPSDCNADKDIDKVIKGGQRAANLVRQILAFSRKEPLNLKLLAPHLVIEEALKMICSSLPTTIMIEKDIDPECGKIEADSTQLHQIIVNLIFNAFHAIENEKGTIKIELERREMSPKDMVGEPDAESGSFVILSVSDTGCGMSKATIERIFEPYFTTKDKDQGSGLGLAVIHGIVKRYHGFIRVESEPGKGSSFHVYIPAFKKESIAPEETEETIKIASLPIGRERILVVDDESMIVRLNKTILERLGYKVTATTDSREALQLIQMDPDQFDLIVTDQSMPNLSGVDLAREVLAIKSTMPIILCTGYSAVISEKEALAIDIRKHLIKPVDSTTLAEVVRQVLDNG